MNIFKSIPTLFLIVILSVSYNSCLTIDDLQFDNLALRNQIDSLSHRVIDLTERILDQQTALISYQNKSQIILNPLLITLIF